MVFSVFICVDLRHLWESYWASRPGDPSNDGTAFLLPTSSIQRPVPGFGQMLKSDFPIPDGRFAN
jgi:hypothetical protein